MRAYTDREASNDPEEYGRRAHEMIPLRISDRLITHSRVHNGYY